MSKKHKNNILDTETDLPMGEDVLMQRQTSPAPEEQSKKKHKRKKIRNTEEKIETETDLPMGEDVVVQRQTSPAPEEQSKKKHKSKKVRNTEEKIETETDLPMKEDVFVQRQISPAPEEQSKKKHKSKKVRNTEEKIETETDLPMGEDVFVQRQISPAPEEQSKKKHKSKKIRNTEEKIETETDVPMAEDVVVQRKISPCPVPEEQSKKKHKSKKIRNTDETMEFKIETVNGSSGKSLPVIGYFPSGYDPEKLQPSEEPAIRVLKHVQRNNRLQVVVSPSESSPVNFVGTNYSGEASAPQMCSYALGVLDKQTQTLKIVQIEANKIFRLEPRFGDHDKAADDETSKKVENVATVEDSKTKFNFSTKKSERKAKKARDLRAYREPEAQQDLITKMADVTVNTEAITAGAENIYTARNIPLYDMTATTPHQAYPLQKIILKGEWSYLLDIVEFLQQGKDIRHEGYPLFVCNRIHKIKEVKDEEARESLGCIFSYINHLIKFKDKHSMDGFLSAKHHKLPSILTQKFNKTFGNTNTESKVLADDKRDLLISYVLVLTLFVDNFKTEFSDIAKDLRMSTGALRPHFQFLGCKLAKEKDKMLATLSVPLKFPELRIRRRKRTF